MPLIGSLNYLTHTHLGISFAFGIVSCFMTEPHELHWKASKHIMHYIWGIHRYATHYATYTSSNLIGYTDYDWVGDLNDHNSTSSYSFQLGSNPICWQSKKQHVSALSSTKDEYQGVLNAATEDIWLHNILTKLGITFHKPSIIYCDN